MISRKTIFWMVPILTAVHNVEEALFMPIVIQRRNSSVPSMLSGLLPPITYRQFLLAIFVMTLIPFLVAIFTDTRRERTVGARLLLCFQVMMLMNVFAHLFMAGIMGGYAPGVITALVINLPFSIYMLNRAIQEQWVNRKTMMILGSLGVLLHMVMLPGIMSLSGKIMNGF